MQSEDIPANDEENVWLYEAAVSSKHEDVWLELVFGVSGLNQQFLLDCSSLTADRLILQPAVVMTLQTEHLSLGKLSKLNLFVWTVLKDKKSPETCCC